MSTYVAELRKIAEHCEYGTVLSDMLRDRLVCGISNKAVQRRLLQETALVFDKAPEMALAAEAAEKDSRRLTGAFSDNVISPRKEELVPPLSQTPVNKVGPHKQDKPQSGGSNSFSKPVCFRCGGKHLSSGCPCKDFECHFCKKRGHLAKVCRKKSRTRNRPKQANVVEPCPEEEYTMFHIQSRAHKPFTVLVTANGNPLCMEIDTGASVSIVGEETFKSIRRGRCTLELQDTKVKLQTYT